MLTGTGYPRGRARNQARRLAQLCRLLLDSSQWICERTSLRTPAAMQGAALLAAHAIVIGQTIAFMTCSACRYFTAMWASWLP